MTPEQRWERAGLADDFVFSKVMADPVICRKVIQRILPDKHIGKITTLSSQQEVNLTSDAKGVRFDVYIEDEQHTRYDLEMQVVNHHNVAKRARFYQAAMTNDALEKGSTYQDVDNSYVIFFCMFDPLGYGLQRYTVCQRVSEHPMIVVDDGTMNIFFNVPSLRRDVSLQLQRFLDVIAQRMVEEDDDFIVQLRKKIKFVKHNKKWRAEFMRKSLYEMDHQYELEQAEKQGIITTVKVLKEVGTAPAIIVQKLVDNYQLTPQQAKEYLNAK